MGEENGSVVGMSLYKEKLFMKTEENKRNKKEIHKTGIMGVQL